MVPYTRKTDPSWMPHLKKLYLKRKAADKMARKTRKEQRRRK